MLLRPQFLLTFTIFLVIYLTNVQGRLFAQDDAVSWKERYLTKAPLAWEKYRERAKQFQGTVERTQLRLPGREIMDHDRCEIKQRGASALFLAQSLGGGNPPDYVGVLMGINDRYGFELRRQTSEAAWALTQLDVDLSDGMHFRVGSPPDESVVFWSTCPVTLFLIPLFHGVEMTAPEFMVQTVTPITHKNTQAVKVELEYHPPANKPKSSSIKGWIVFDPQHSWVIREYEFQFEWAESVLKGSVAVTYEYQEAKDGLPIPKRATRRFTPVGGVDRENQYEFDLKEATVPERDFTLSAFGLPEPGGTLTSSTPWYLWAAGLGIVCLIMAALLRWRSRSGTVPTEPGSQVT